MVYRLVEVNFQATICSVNVGPYNIGPLKNTITAKFNIWMVEWCPSYLGSIVTINRWYLVNAGCPLSVSFRIK
jgi:hypothetical protein